MGVKQFFYFLPTLIQLACLIAINVLGASSKFDIKNAKLSNPYPYIGLSILSLALYFIIELWCDPNAQVKMARDLYTERRERSIPDNLVFSSLNARRTEIDTAVNGEAQAYLTARL